jgi:hypothetical protein
MLRRITYIDPTDETTYVSLTTEMTLPPGILALIYKQRWDVEKTFDELKSKLVEKKAWGSSPPAKSSQAMFLCLTHNLMVLLEEELRRVERIDNAPERKRKAGRKEKAEESGVTDCLPLKICPLRFCKVNNRLATALRMAAQSLHRSKAGLGDWFRRLKAKLGTKAAVTAAAHKLARILWAMVKHRRPYDPARLGNPELAHARKERYLRRQAEQLGFTLTPVHGEVS